MRSRILIFLLSSVFLWGNSCDKNILDRIPQTSVFFEFDPGNPLIGLTAPTTHCRFIKTATPGTWEPKGISYPISYNTGFGGTLVICGYTGAMFAFDLACPVEATPTVRIAVDEKELCARCPKCNSTYDVYEGTGGPMSGPAKERRFFLRTYRISGPLANTYYRVSL